MATRTIAPAGLRMAAQAKAPTKNFWEGEWVCADCGYIYDVEDCGGIFLEEQVRSESKATSSKPSGPRYFLFRFVCASFSPSLGDQGTNYPLRPPSVGSPRGRGGGSGIGERVSITNVKLSCVNERLLPEGVLCFSLS